MVNPLFRRCVSLFLCLCGSMGILAGSAPDLAGRLDPRLHVHTRWTVETHSVTRVRDLPGQSFWAATFHIPPLNFLRTGGEAELVLADTANGRQLYVDLDRNGVVAPDERVPMLPTKLGARWVIRFRFTGEQPGTWGVVAMLKPSSAESEPPTLVLDPSPYVTGYATVSGREIAVRMRFDPVEMNVDSRVGWIGIDSDANGTIDTDAFSAESTYADNEDVVLRVLDRYVSIARADVNSGTFQLLERPARDYERMELTLGSVAPDFGFHTLDGKEHRLSDYAGRYVLLFIWDTGCENAKEEVAAVRAAYSRFSERGFVVLGLSDDQDIENTRRFIAEHDMTWPQVLGPQAVELVHRRLRAVGMPSVVLLDRERRVVSRNDEGEPPIRGDALLATIEGLLGRR